MRPGAGLRAALVGTSVLTASVLAVPAPATVRPVCHLIADARGDAAVGEPGPSGRIDVVPGGPTDDLLSADIASDGRTVTAVLRLADIQVPDPAAPLGHAYELTFRVAGSTRTQYLLARTYLTGTRFQYGYAAHDATGRLTYDYALGEARGTVDTAHHEVRVHAPAAGLLPRGRVRTGSLLIGLHAAVYRWWGQGAVDSQEVVGVRVPLAGTGALLDEAEGNRYVVGTPSCVRPGA